MNNLFVIPIEPIETRYTKHWYEFIPKQLAANTNFRVTQLELPADKTSAPANSDGGFFNFTFTSAFKANQVQLIADQFSSGAVQDGDVFLYTDYWNPSVGFLKYMAAMANKKIKILGIAHAGLWDPQDMLTRSFGSTDWGNRTELYLNSCYDTIMFATEFSKSLFEKTYGPSPRNLVTGFPMEYYTTVMPNYWDLPNPPKKEEIVVFPHRKAPEKNYELFLQLQERMPEFKFVVALDVCKTKEEYHDLMYRSLIAFSAATQETLGISMGIEALCAGVIPIVPNRLSYAEIFKGGPFLYDDDSIESCVENIRAMSAGRSTFYRYTQVQRDLSDRWFHGKRMYEYINSLNVL